MNAQRRPQRPRQPRAGDLRLSDAERDAAVERLSEHYAAGRLDKDEFDERSDAVWTAKTGSDLEPVFADLEPARPVRATGWVSDRAAWGRRGWTPVPFLPVLLILIALTVITHVPFLLLALLAGAFVFSRRRRRRW
jgi:hypothetical protein